MGTSTVEARTERSLSSFLLSAVSEWLVICMLLVDSIFSFFITKCARFFNLLTPCLLCSRLDHIFGSEKRGYLWKLLCGKHKLEISSLVLCHAHNKLVNVHEMCETCLFSFATINKSNSETYRLLVGKLGEDTYPGIDKDPLLGEQKHCSCCKEPYVSRGFVQTLIQTRSSGLETEDLDVPLLSSVVHCKEDFKESTSNLLPHVQYRELKITSDTESDGNGSILGVETANSKDDLTIKGVHMEPNFISPASNLTSTKIVEPALAPEPLVLEPLVLLGDDPGSDGNESTLGVETANSNDGLTVQGVHMEPNFISLASNLSSTKLVEPASAPEPLVLEPLVVLDDELPPVECGGVSIGHGLDELTPKNIEAYGDFSSPTYLLTLDGMLPSSNTIATFDEALEKSYVTRSEEYETECRETEKAETLPTKATSEAGSEAQPVSNDAVQMAPNILELGDAYKLAVGPRGGRQLSGKLSEQWIGKDSSKVSEDVKLLMSQLSFNRDQSRDMSPRLSINGDEPRNFDVSGAAGMQILQRRFSLERNESSLEYLDGGIVSEIEGENAVDRLKRQVDYDKRLMSSLYKELDEERNASAIATNQAMAMITRLQEEKASLHMEALQCLRVMEEQSEYDEDALQKANDLITEKDKEIQDLEAELEFYRISFPNAYTIENLVETSNVKERDIGVVHLESNQILGNPVAGKPDIHEKVGSEGSTYNNLLLEFEDEKLDIMKSLKKLENSLHLFSNNGVEIDLSCNGQYFGNKGSFSSGANEFDSDKRKLEDGEDHAGLPEKNPHADADDDCLPSHANPSFDQESSELDYSDKNSLMVTGMTDFASLRNEMSNLNERMEVLQADKNILEHTINSLRKGEEGLQFVQEIASHLRELRKIGTRS